jgi:4-hydroxy-tetrahydrodipicolinate synthase
MKPVQPLYGVFAAAVTPLNEDYSIQMKALPGLLHFLAQRGCHGVLLFGTTGEGPSFSIEERCRVFQLAADIRQELPNFRLLAGTGTPSLEDTIKLTCAAYENGFDAAVVLPPYYFRKATEDGLFAWYECVIRRSVPKDGVLLGYHFPVMSGVPLSIELLSRLKDAFPAQFGGLKDSSGDLDYTHLLDQRFGSDLMVLIGNDHLFSQALHCHVSGCITAMANLFSPLLRRVWDSFHSGQPDQTAQAQIDDLRNILDSYPPNPAIIKALLPRLYNLPAWSVRPPLVPLKPDVVEKALRELEALESVQRESPTRTGMIH